MKSTAVCCLLALLALPAAGLEPYLVKDVNPGSGPEGSNPLSLVTLGGAVLFFADDGDVGLWRSDGTAAGTFRLSDLGGPGDQVYPYLLTEDRYFLQAGETLWVSDGTPAGTFPLTDFGVQLRPGGIWVPSQGVLYFPAQDAEHGLELWRTDGTPAGTHLVADVRPGPEGSRLQAQSLAEYRGRVWFGADDGQQGGALWSSDGTAAGTVLAVDPLPSSAGHGAPELVRAVGDRLTFVALSPGRSQRRQLWAGDGTPRGTAPVTALSGGKGRSSLYDSVVQGNRLYFVAEDRRGQELWVSDGTVRGTRVLTALPKRDAFFSSSSLLLGYGQGLNGRFVFRVDDGPHGTEAWITDGTPRGTLLLRDICPGVCSGAAAPLRRLAGRLYLSANDGSTGSELWSTDGTPAGTRRVVDLCPGPCGSDPFAAFVLGDRLLFLARDGQTGREIWSTGGTAEGTIRISDFEADWDGSHGAVVGGRLLFDGSDSQHGKEIWRTDGTPAGTWLVEDINQVDVGGSFPTGLRPLGSRVVFAADDGDKGLWKSDGTPAGTVRIRTFGPGELDGADPQGAFAEAAGRLFYFSKGLGQDRYVPWRTDGTEAGTFRLTTAESVTGCCFYPEMRAAGSTVFLALQDEEHGRELWASDGTAAGTRMVLDIRPGPEGSFPNGLTAFQGRLWFSAYTPEIGQVLWTSDGTAAGTVPVVGLVPPVNPRLLTVHGGRLWFFATDAEHGRELWSSDGTPGGTGLAVDVVPGADSFEAMFMASLGDRLLFAFYGGHGFWATDGSGTRKISAASPERWTLFQGRLYYTSGATLWVTDGTEAGTGPFLDREGQAVEGAKQFAALGDRLVFTTRNRHGFQLWESDGTPAGTFPFRVLESEVELLHAGDRVFFPGYDPAAGHELWAVRP